MKKGRVTIKTKRASGWGNVAKNKIYGYEISVDGVPVIFTKTKAEANRKAKEIRRSQGSKSNKLQFEIKRDKKKSCD